MKKIRLLFCFLIFILTSGFTACGKLTGVQVNRYVLSDCPSHDYKIPNFAETEDLIFTQADLDPIACSDFRHFTIMNKEKISNEPAHVALLIDRKESKCTIKLLTKRYCSNHDKNCLAGSPTMHPISNIYDFKDLLPKFLFGEKKITITKEEDPTIITGNEFKNLCKWQK